MSRLRIIDGRELVQRLAAAGIIPDNCCRVVIDVKYPDPVRIYYEVYGDERLLEVDFSGPGIEVKEP